MNRPIYVWWWNANRSMWCCHRCRDEDAAYNLAFEYVKNCIPIQIKQGAPA